MRAPTRAALALGGGALLLGVVLASYADARTIDVSPAPGEAATALAGAKPGDVVLLKPGTYAGPLEVARAITLRGEPGAVIDGGGRGTVLRVTASGATVENVSLRGSGRDVQETDAGIHVASASLVTLRGLVVTDVLYGIYGERSEGLVVEDCRLTGRVAPSRASENGDGNGNGIHLWYSSDARLTRNTVERYQDGIYLSFANRTHAEGNRLRDCGRYGLHTMYCQATELVGNLFTRNAAGCAIMFSNHLLVQQNAILHNRGPRTYGLLLRDCSAGRFVGNQLVDNTIAIFMDNSNHNRIQGNLFQDNGWGLLMFSSCAGNETSRNTFMNNDYPVALDMRYSDNRFDDGRRGNYWSDNAPYDLDADGVGDIPYSPVSAFAFVSKQYPDLAILAKSPAVAAITVAERVFPALRPSEIVDRFPLISPTAVPHPRGGDDAGRARPAWAAASAFAGLLLAGTLGLAWTRARPMIRVEGLVKRYGTVTAVDHLSFHVEPGETFALIGPNGAGKTTTLKILLGLARPTEGRVTIGGLGLPPHDARARHDLGYVPQRVEFAPGRTVSELLGFFADLRGLARTAVERALARVGLLDYAGRRASELSGGYTQRLSLAQALLGDPALLVLDEPTASLDPEATWEFRSLLEQLQREGKTVILSSHLLTEVERVADRVLILLEGRQAALERMDELKSRQVKASRLLIDLGGDKDRAAATLLARGLRFEAVGAGELVVEAADGQGLAALEALRSAGIQPKSFQAHGPTLEEMFLAVVRGGRP